MIFPKLSSIRVLKENEISIFRVGASHICCSGCNPDCMSGCQLTTQS